jgi:DNA-binding transcriptional regulator YiaG
MKKKIAKEFLYEGFGFPILLLNVPIREVRGVEVPDINYNVLQKSVLEMLARKASPLTGNEVRFIRQYFELTLMNFAKRFGVTHPAVLKWEKSKNKIAKIMPSTELYIRLFIVESLKASNEAFRNTFNVFDSNDKLKKPDGLHASLKPIRIESGNLCA